MCFFKPSVELIAVRCSDTAKSDLLALYRDASEIGIHKFHEAHLKNDTTAAHSEIVRCHLSGLPQSGLLGPGPRQTGPLFRFSTTDCTDDETARTREACEAKGGRNHPR